MHLASLKLQPMLQNQIKKAQLVSEEYGKVIQTIHRSENTELTVDEDGVIRFGKRLWVPNEVGLRKEIMKEAHSSTYSIHLGSTKMYKDLKQHFWWTNMKRDVAEFVSKCLTCEQVRIRHQRPGGVMQPLPSPEWKWENITMDFVTASPRTPSGYEVVWVIIDRLMKSAHFIPLRVGYSLEKLAQLYIKEIVRLHGVLMDIVSDRDLRFVSRF